MLSQSLTSSIITHSKGGVSFSRGKPTYLLNTHLETMNSLH